ncbi:MAG: hypothetical protein Q8O13_05090 [Candidatus Omnitrophota bacterium]|nr:hypothetical protein [Candidatus Omnitrophota bacterium]
MNNEFSEKIEEICQKDSRYKSDAYEFLMEALFYTQKTLKKAYHVTGKELLEGIRQLVLERFGPMVLIVLEHWGIKKTEDFGEIVFNLVNRGLLKKTEEDKISDFKDVFDFKEAFVVGYKELLQKQIKKGDLESS